MGSSTSFDRCCQSGSSILDARAFSTLAPFLVATGGNKLDWRVVVKCTRLGSFAVRVRARSARSSLGFGLVEYGGLHSFGLELLDGETVALLWKTIGYIEKASKIVDGELRA